MAHQHRQGSWACCPPAPSQRTCLASPRWSTMSIWIGSGKTSPSRCHASKMKSRPVASISSYRPHHRPVATDTGDEEWQDKTLLQQSHEYRIHLVLKCLAPVSHPMVLPLVLRQVLVL